MPNSCNSISKLISILFLVYLGSCSSISHSTFSEKVFVGKLSSTNTQDLSNFNIRVKAFPENVIIQIGKPLFGNLLKIQFNYSTGLSFNPKIDNQYLSLLKKFKNEDYIKFFNSCLNNFKVTEKVFILKKHDVKFKCIHQDQDTLLVNFFYGNEINLNGVLKRG
ncbi:hypothetical protein OAK21_00775 [Pseudomonadota bacterium]|nr:hypothetical protein [Pseudomonadota bacterium]